jgi:hypothetical protein
MAGVKTTLNGRTADPTVKPLGFLDESGGAGTGPFDPLHASIDSSGALINPATSDLQAVVNTQTTAIAVASGTPADAGWTGTGSGSVIALLKAIWTKTGSGAVTIADGANTTQGALADTAWSGSGSGSLVAVLKAIWTQLSGSLVTKSAQTTGLAFSINQPTLPNIGANFAASGPFASYVLVGTVAAAARNTITIINATAGQIAIVRDDGTAAAAAAPVNASVFPLAGATTAGQMGSAWSNSTFRGRLQIYAPAALSGNAFVSIFVD